MPRTCRSLLAVLTAGALLTLTAVPATAGQRAGDVTFRPIVGTLDGRTGPALLADSFLPDYVGPTAPADECPRLGRHGKVVWVGPVSVCHLRPGDIPVALPAASCSDVEEPPFYAVGEAAQRACAQEYNAFFVSLLASVDGGRAVDLTRRAFAVSPRQRHIVIPADNPGGFPAGRATFTADGWAAVLCPLTPGTHHVHVVGTLEGVDEPVEEDFTLVVAPRRHR